MYAYLYDDLYQGKWKLLLPVFCPVGTFFNVVSDTCESCGQGTYQPKQGTVTCLVCPGNTSTHLNNSKSAKECKGGLKLCL